MGGDSNEAAVTGWFRRHLWTSPSRSRQEQSAAGNEKTGMGRPQTAPSTGIATDPTTTNLHPVDSKSLPNRTVNQPPPRPPRPDSSTIRDIHAWLNAGEDTPSRALMGGIPYWRTGALQDVGPAANVQYAIPITHKADSDGGHLKALYHRAKRMHIQMPSILQKSQRTVEQKEPYEQATPMPHLPGHYKETALPIPPVKPNSAVQTGKGSDVAPEGSQPSANGPIHTMPGKHLGTGGFTRPFTANAQVARERSIGTCSDAPSYFTGPSPPSYRSRTVSAVTTSSFGCVDGMNREYRQHEERKPTRQNGCVKERLRRLARRAHIVS